MKICLHEVIGSDWATTAAAALALALSPSLLPVLKHPPALQHYNSDMGMLFLFFTSKCWHSMLVLGGSGE